MERDGFILQEKKSTLLRRITSKHHRNFYCLICLHSFATKNKLESDKNLFKNKDFCNVIMPSEKLKEIFFNTCKFSKNGRNKFILLL